MLNTVKQGKTSPEYHSVSTGPAQNKDQSKHRHVTAKRRMRGWMPPAQENSCKEEKSDIASAAGSVSQLMVGGCVEPRTLNVSRPFGLH